MSPEERAYVSPAWLAQLDAATTADPWTHGFAVIERQGGEAIGSAGFTGPPDQEGAVEMAYAIDPPFRGRGYATEAAQALLEFAFTDMSVALVRAHTLPETNASTRILTKCGFKFLGVFEHPEDGLVWRWEKRRTSFGAQQSLRVC